MSRSRAIRRFVSSEKNLGAEVECLPSITSKSVGRMGDKLDLRAWILDLRTWILGFMY